MSTTGASARMSVNSSSCSSAGGGLNGSNTRRSYAGGDPEARSASFVARPLEGRRSKPHDRCEDGVMADDDDLPPGLVDLDAPDADAQRELAAYLLGRGIPVSELRAARAEG